MMCVQITVYTVLRTADHTHFVALPLSLAYKDVHACETMGEAKGVKMHAWPAEIDEALVVGVVRLNLVSCRE